jgi:hypothetical protein
MSTLYFNLFYDKILPMDELAADSTAPIEKAKNGREIFTKELADEIISACGSGFTLEKAGALVGVNPSTIRTWAQRKPDFGKRVETARKKHELSLLKDVQLAGEKSWQAKAWILERGYNWAQPSARLAVTQEHTHGISSNLASLLAGIAIRKKSQSEKISSPQNNALDIETKQLTNIDSNHKSHTNILYQLPRVVDEQHLKDKTLPRVKHKRMRLRKPRQSRPATTTPPATPPAPA